MFKPLLLENKGLTCLLNQSLVFFLVSPLVWFQFRVFTAPFHRVEFADFWLADQLNSLVFVLMDLEYLICFYIFELQWSNSKGLLPKVQGETLIQGADRLYPKLQVHWASDGK